MAFTLTLINNDGSSEPWPGTPEELDPTACPDGNPMVFTPVWIGLLPDRSASQVFPITTSIATILGGGFTHIYQGTLLDSCNIGQHAYLQSLQQVNQLLAASCCSTVIQTASFALKTSNQSLSPDDAPPPCGAEAIFKWLAVRGTNEVRALQYIFQFNMYSQDGLTVQTFTIVNEDPLTETVQHVKRWPTDFIGLVSNEGKTLVANNVVPGVDDLPVSTFDNGTLDMITRIYTDDIDHTLVSGKESFFIFPGTDCGSQDSSSGGSASASGESESASEVDDGFQMRFIVSPDEDTPSLGWTFTMNPGASQLFVDWGDGNPEETFNQSSNEFEAAHEYAPGGPFTCRLRFAEPELLNGISFINIIHFNTRCEINDDLVALQTIGLSGFFDAFVGIEHIPSINQLFLEGNNFSVASMNTLLDELDALGTSDGFVSLNCQQNDEVNTQPTNTTAITNLEGRGWTVQTGPCIPPPM